MLDLKWIRENPDLAKKGIEAKGMSLDLSALFELDQRRRSLLQEVEALKAERNKVNEEISRLKKAGESADETIQSMRAVSQKIKEMDGEVGGIDVKICEMTSVIPNIPDKTVPIANGAQGNKVVREIGELKEFNFKPRNHLELADMKEPLFSMALGSKISGSGFPVFTGFGARLERALINFMMDLHAKKHGYTEIWPPALVNRASMTGTGQLPKLEEDMYALKDEDFFLIPTAEVPVTNLWRDEVIPEEKLPIKYVAYTPCFRREAGSYGKDTQGLMRVHQFDKVELVKFVKPETAMDELEALVSDAEAVLQALELPYRVVLLGSGDMSFAAAKCYDLEVWAPGTEKWCEVSSCSVFGDFQARRANIKYRSGNAGRAEYVHTLNGSGVALARTVLCLLENFQTQDGSIKLPKTLKAYL